MMPKLFKNWTKQEKLAAWLMDLGLVEVECRSSKYQAFRRPQGGATWFLGKAGGFRKSCTGRISDSFSMTPNREGFERFCTRMEVNP